MSAERKKLLKRYDKVCEKLEVLNEEATYLEEELMRVKE